MATTTAAMSDYFEENALKHFLGISQAPFPSGPNQVEVRLYSTNPTDAGGGTELPMGTHPGYGFIALSPSGTSVVQDGTGYAWVPNVDLSWTATGNWPGPVAYVGITTGGGTAFIAHGAIDDGSGGAITVSSGQTLTISCNGTSSSNLKIKLT